MGLTLLQMNQGSKAFGGQKLFDSATFSVNEGEHIGVIGPNGAGKTTLFKILNQLSDLDSGQLIRSQSLRLGYLSQHDEWSDEETGNSFLHRISQRPIWETKSEGRDLKVTEAILDRPIKSLSGGYRMRIKLIGLLGQDPNLLLLDEPTNYLDLETTLLLESFLQSYRGAFLLISHDREFLRRTTDHIVEVEGGDITKYNGNIDDYFEQKELLRSQLQAKVQSQAEKRKSIEDFVNRFGAKATKAKQAQSRMKQLEKMESIEIKPVPVSAAIQIPEPNHVGRFVVQVRNAQLGYGKNIILKDVQFDIERGDHIAVVGFNGAGKSTLLKSLAQTLSPIAGEVKMGHQVEWGIFNQHVVEVLNPHHTIFEALESVASTQVTPQEIRNMAGSLLFSSDQINKRIEVLSGGEKSRVALGQILLKKVPLLLLDEPTNHLDFQTVEALTQALERFKGTVIAVSHDRGFIRRMATKILEVEQGRVSVYPGTYDEYVWSMQRKLSVDVVLEAKNETPKSKVISGSESKEKAKMVRSLQKKIESVEQKIKAAQDRVQILNEKILSESQPDRNWIQELADTAILIEKLEEEWIELESEKMNFM